MRNSTLKRLIIYLSSYIFLMGLIGFFRTGSSAPIIISGSMASITFLLGTFAARENKGARKWLVRWLFVELVLFIASALQLVGAHQNPQPGQELIFGSMALFTTYVLYRLLLNRDDKPLS